jgi:hypothetical protein
MFNLKAQFNGYFSGVSMRFVSITDGTFVRIDAATLPRMALPYDYRIHQNAIVNNNCNTAGPVFDPLNVYGGNVKPLRGDYNSYPVGDLSGTILFLNAFNNDR